MGAALFAFGQPAVTKGYALRGLRHSRCQAIHWKHQFLPILWCVQFLKRGRMAAPTIAPISVVLDDVSGSGQLATPALLGGMLRAAEKISDLIFSPGRPPQV